jgi:hypothetical protein
MAEISVYTHNRYVKVGLRQCCHAANKPCTRRLWRSSGLSNADGNRFRKIFSMLVFCRAGCYLLIEIVFDPSPKLYQRVAAADWPERAYISLLTSGLVRSKDGTGIADARRPQMNAT